MMWLLSCSTETTVRVRNIENFGRHWKFHLGDIQDACKMTFDDSGWRELNLPHDWSIEGEFRKDNPATAGGGALPGGIGWYRKVFTIPAADSTKLIFIEFDGVYQNGEVWINDHYLGKRPYGYSSFRYELMPYLNYGAQTNVMAVKVDNSLQPNSRWYSGSGIYRNVWLVTTAKIFIDQWGTYVTTPQVTRHAAQINIKTSIVRRRNTNQSVDLKTSILYSDGKLVTSIIKNDIILEKGVTEIEQELSVKRPVLWSDEHPYLYRIVSQVLYQGEVCDDYETPLGIRTFRFDAERGFILNDKSVKIKGVCNHHDLGCLGAAVNVRALERQLELLKAMGCNAIRTSHNPPAPELLDLCDRMGFIVMDEAFDVWAIPKTPYGYNLFWEEWHRRDLQDMVRRDRNHPSVFIWSIGNEVMEQWNRQDSSGIVISKELAEIVKSLDHTRPITSACNGTDTLNPVIRSGALDLIGFNYAHQKYADFPAVFPGKPFLASETESALATRGSYDMPSDSIRRWPKRWDLPFYEGNPDYSCSAYDNCSTPWGSTHEETWKIIKRHAFISGAYIWTGFDYLGEPTPYDWPARSSYFGIIDLAGFPKDAFYFYQSEWTDQPVLHIFPHWNWNPGDSVDVWAFTNYDRVELFLNGVSLGEKIKGPNDYKLVWRLAFSPGTLKAVAHKSGWKNLIREIRTAGEPAQIAVSVDRQKIRADGCDLSFVSVKVLDGAGNLVPHADNLVSFRIEGPGLIAGVDNGSQISHEPFKSNQRKVFNGLGLAVIQASEQAGQIKLTATSDGLKPATLTITTK